MAQLDDLITKPIKQMTDEELEHCIMLMKKMKVNKEKKPVKTNKDKQLNNLLNNLTPEQLSIMMNKLKGGI